MSALFALENVDGRIRRPVEMLESSASGQRVDENANSLAPAPLPSRSPSHRFDSQLPHKSSPIPSVAFTASLCFSSIVSLPASPAPLRPLTISPTPSGTSHDPLHAPPSPSRAPS
jgi:hypothetical protein